MGKEANMSAEVTLDPTNLGQKGKDSGIDTIGTDYQYGFHDKEDYIFKSGRGLTREIVTKISEMKKEPEWMLKFRLRALLLHQAIQQAGKELGRRPRRYQKYFRPPRHPRSRAQIPGRRHRPV
jgi:hypothetical protein